MYQIDIMPVEKNNDSTKEILGIMIDVLETINNVDDIPTFNSKMKIIANIDFILDNLMDQYINVK